MSNSDQSSALGPLWSEAVRKFEEEVNAREKGKIHFKLEDVNNNKLQDVTQANVNLGTLFHNKRHDGSKSAAVRSAFSKHLDGIQKCFSVVQAAGNAAASFPPAMPASLIFGACSHVLKAFAAVQADYNKVEEFFLTTTRFFDRLSAIDGIKLEAEPLMRCIGRVFTCILTIYRIAYSMIKHASHFMGFMNALWSLDNPDLAAAFTGMKWAIDELNSAVGLTNLNVVVRANTEVVLANEKLDRLDIRIGKIAEECRAAGLDVHEVMENVVGIQETMNDILGVMTRRFDRVDTGLTKLEYQISQIVQRLPLDKQRGNTQKPDSNRFEGKPDMKRDISKNKLAAVNTIREYLNRIDKFFDDWTTASNRQVLAQKEVESSTVAETGQWLFDNATFRAWTEGDDPLLWIRGPTGIGKTYLAHECVKRLRKSQSVETVASVAHFAFDQSETSSTLAFNAFACIAMQIAEANPKYASQLAAALEKDHDEGEDFSPWTKLIASRFPPPKDGTSSTDRAWIVFDGLEDLDMPERSKVTAAITSVNGGTSNVKVLLVSRWPGDLDMGASSPLVIDMDKDKIRSGLKVMIRHQLKSLPRTKRFTRSTRKTIVQHLSLKADGMLYAEHMLHRFNHIGREGAVLKSLSDMPNTLHELYDMLLAECRGKRPSDELQALKRLFAWLAFSKSPLTLGQASALINVTLEDKSFDIEDEIIGRSSRILDLSKDIIAETLQGGDDSDDNEPEDTTHEQTGYRDSELTFRDRPLRQYFRSLVEDDPDSIRMPASSAHLTIFEMSTDILLRCAKSSKDVNANELVQYAADFWYEHFLAICSEAALDVTTKIVVQNLYHIMSNSENVSRVLEEYANERFLYGTKDDPLKWNEQAMLWIEKASSVPQLFSEDVQEWVKRVASHQESLFLHLSRGHVSNWLEVKTTAPSYKSYWCAYRTLELDHRLGKYGIREEQISDIARSHVDEIENWKVSRAIGSIFLAFHLSQFQDEEDFQSTMTEIGKDDTNPQLTDRSNREQSSNIEKANNTQEADDRDLAIKFLHDAIGGAPDTAVEQWHSYYLLADAYGNVPGLPEEPVHENLEKAIEASNQAIGFLENEVALASSEQFIQTLVNKADFLRRLKRKMEALETYDMARARASTDYYLEGYTLYCTSLLIEDEDLFAKLQSWSEKERVSWMKYVFDYWAVDDTIERLIKLIRTGGETEMTFISQMFDDFQKKAMRSSHRAINIQIQRARLFQEAIADTVKAKELYREVLNITPISEDWFVAEWLFSDVRLRLAELIYSEFNKCLAVGVKRKLMEELRDIPHKVNLEHEDGASYIGFLLALMLRVLGPWEDFEKQMNLVFSACLKGLSDHFGWNDSSSLRLLAQICSLVPGLERDASIAVSAQIYDLELLNTDVSEPKGNEKSTDSTGMINTKIIDDRDAPTSAPAGKEAVLVEVTTKLVQTEQGIVTSPRRISVAPDEQPDEQRQSEAQTESQTDEDIISSNYCPDCNGCDRFKMEGKWTVPLYLCIQCANIDLCEDCHAKRLKLNQGDPSEDWKVCCAPDHAYVKAPITGWKGVKDGWIYIGDEKFKVRDWLNDLRDVRWKKAWEDLWRERALVRTVEV